MKKITCLIFLLVVAHTPSHAEIFKCKLASELTVYQSSPCPSTTVKQNVLETNADRIAKAQSQLAARKADWIAREAAALKIEKARHEELARQKLITLRKRRIIEDYPLENL